MTHNSRVRPFGTWTLASALTTAEIQQIDTYCFEAVSGDQGGTWAPLIPITIGGAGVELTGPVSISGALEVTGTTLIENDVTVSGAAVTLESSSSLTLDDSTMELTNAAAVNMNTGTDINVLNGGDINIASGGDLNVQSGGEIKVESSGLVSVESGGQAVVLSGGALTVASGATFTAAGTNVLSGSTTVSGAVSQTNTLTKSGTGGRTRWRSDTLASNASHTIDVDFDTYYYTQSTAVSRTITLRVSTAPVPLSGERIVLHITSTSANPCTIQNEGGSTLCEVTNTHVRLWFEFDGTSWRLIMSARDPGLGGTFTWSGSP